MIKSAKNKKRRTLCSSLLLILRARSSLLLILRALNHCRCLPKAELNTKTNPNGHHSVAVWVRFGVQLDYSCRLKSVPSNGINRVQRSLVEFLVSNSAFDRYGKRISNYVNNHRCRWHPSASVLLAVGREVAARSWK